MSAFQLMVVALRRDKGFSPDMDTLLPIVIGVVVLIVVIAVVAILLKKKNNKANADVNEQYGAYDYNAGQPYGQPYDNFNPQGYAPVPDYSIPDPMQGFNQPVSNSSFESFEPAAPVENTPVQPAVPVVPAPAYEATEIVAIDEQASETKTYVKLVNVQTGASYEAELGEQLTIGKRDCGITIPDDNSISGTHCQIYTYETNYVLADMQSTNGTKLNDYKIETPVFIENGSILGIGKQKFTVTFEKK